MFDDFLDKYDPRSSLLILQKIRINLKIFKTCPEGEDLKTMKWFAPALPSSLHETQLRCILASPIILKTFYN